VSFSLYFDEQQRDRVAARLEMEGYDVLTTSKAGLASLKTPDEAQLAFASEQGRAIVTSDMADFIGLHRRWWERSRHHAGIIIVTPNRSPGEIHDGIVRLQELYPDGISDLILLI
jgi:predicted nuclease of predicted toxin-antitoxin system